MPEIVIADMQYDDQSIKSLARSADLNKNGKLDSNEQSVFMGYLKDYSYYSFLDVITKEDVPGYDKETAENLKSLIDESSTLRYEIKDSEKVLYQMKDKSAVMRSTGEPTDLERVGGVVLCGAGMIGVGGAAAKAGALVGGFFGPLGAAAGALIAGTVGMLAGTLAGTDAFFYARDFVVKRSSDYKDCLKKAEDYEKTTIEPMEDKIKQLKERREIIEHEIEEKRI